MLDSFQGPHHRLPLLGPGPERREPQPVDDELLRMKENGGVVQTVAFRSYVDSEKNAANREAQNA